MRGQVSDHRGYVLKLVSDLVYYAGLFYGDWSVIDGPPSQEDVSRYTMFDAQLAVVPDEYRQCVCQQPGYFNCSVPGILAHFENGRLPPSAKVERCDQCQRYPDDAAARQDLLDEGLIWESESCPQLYSVHCYVTVRVKLTGIAACSPQDAARKAQARFDWDEHQKLADFADEMDEFLVDLNDAPDFDSSRRFNADLEEIDT